MSEFQPNGEHSIAKTIFERQNEDWAIGLLAAQKWTYTRAKSWTGLAFFFAAFVALCLPVFVKYCDCCIPPLFAYWSLAAALMLVALLRFRAGFLRRQAAGIQENLDVSLFAAVNLSSQHIHQPRPALIHRALLWGKNGNLQNWYNPPPEFLAADADIVLFCQQQNLGWNQTLNQQYSRWLSKTFGLYLGLLLLLSGWYLCGLNLQLWWESLLIYQIPLLLLLLHVYSSHLRSTEQNDQRLRQLVAEMQQAQQTPASPPQIQAIQDGIYAIRANNEPIPDWFYNWHRPALNRVIYKTHKGASVAVEESRPAGWWGRLGFVYGGSVTAATELEAALEPIRLVADTVVEHLEATQAEEINIEMGLRLEAGMEAAIAKATGEGQIKVSVKWTRKG